ncbi:flagellar export protein FliJ [Phenylobacterium sp.]|jgi:flagellar FliJ protein|uniref:flagellar export protein FliJ n=1 Tax=Phenylobacterium sp. TaxID=1871053 RepID=UPI002F933F78
MSGGWAKSLIKLSTYEVEVRQKRLAEIGERRMAAEMQLAVLSAQGEAESAACPRDPGSIAQLLAYLKALNARKADVHAKILEILEEERGARDSLAQAFEEQKKYEHVAEQMRLDGLKKQGQIESAAMDELGLRRAGGR